MTTAAPTAPAAPPAPTPTQTPAPGDLKPGDQKPGDPKPPTDPKAPTPPTQGKDGKPTAPPVGKDGKPTETDKGKAEEKKTESGEAKSFKLVVRGKEVEVPADQYHRLAQKGLAADATLREHAELQKASAAMIATLKDPKTVWKMLERLGHDPLKMATEFVYDRGVRREKMTEAEREAEDLRAKLAEREEADKRAEAEKMSREDQARVAHWQKAFSQDIISAMDQSPDLPKTPEVVSRLAFHMQQALRNRPEGDDTPLRAIDFVPKVLGELRAAAMALLKNKNGKDILDLLGDDVRATLRKAELEAIGGTPTPPAGTGGDRSEARTPPTTGKKLSRDEWDALVKQRAGM